MSNYTTSDYTQQVQSMSNDELLKSLAQLNASLQLGFWSDKDIQAIKPLQSLLINEVQKRGLSDADYQKAYSSAISEIQQKNKILDAQSAAQSAISSASTIQSLVKSAQTKRNYIIIGIIVLITIIALYLIVVKFKMFDKTLGIKVS